jgi:hypothetical protein
VVLTERRLPPRDFKLGNTQGPFHERAASKWRLLSEPAAPTSLIWLVDTQGL